MTNETKEHVRFELPRDVFGGAEGLIYKATKKDAEHIQTHGIGAQVFEGPSTWEITQVEASCASTGENGRNSQGEKVEVVGVTVSETVLRNPRFYKMRPL